MISGEVVLLIIITLINLVLWFAFFTKLKRSFSPQALLTDIKNEVEKLIIEINKTTLDGVTLIEERTISLKSLIEEADNRLLLQQKQEKGKKREKDILNTFMKKNTISTTEKEVADSYQKMATVPIETEVEDGIQLSIDFESYKANMSENNVQQIKNTPEIVNTKGNLIHEITLNEKVLQLSDAGLLAEEIANKLGCAVTVVQLILDLHSQK